MEYLKTQMSILELNTMSRALKMKLQKFNIFCFFQIDVVFIIGVVHFIMYLTIFKENYYIINSLKIIVIALIYQFILTLTGCISVGLNET